MKSTLFFFLLSLLYILNSGCASEKKSSVVNDIQSTEKNTILIGAGGGFSGFYDGICLTKNGDIYSWKSMTGKPDTLNLLFHTSKDSVDFFFRYLDEMGFDNLQLNNSGNMTSFIERTDGESKHRVQWSSESPNAANAQLSTYFSLVRSYTQRMKK